MLQVQHGRYALNAWLKLHMMKASANRLFFHRFSIFHDLFLDEIPERRDTFRLPQFFGVGEEYRNLARMNIGQNAHQIGKIAGEVIGEHANAEIVQNPLQDTEVIVHGQKRRDVICHQLVHQCRACPDLRRAGVLADQPVFMQVIGAFWHASLLQVIA